MAMQAYMVKVRGPRGTSRLLVRARSDRDALAGGLDRWLAGQEARRENVVVLRTEVRLTVHRLEEREE